MNLFQFIHPTLQKRIFQKVDELMAICDVLKERISEVQATQVKLADAVVGCWMMNFCMTIYAAK
ncbi:MAG: hypothetical protein ABUK01_06355 [Leptospirales bacterium]